MDEEILQQMSEDMQTEQIPQEKEQEIQLPDPNYTPPMFLTSKKAKSQVRNQLYFLEKLTAL